MSKRYREVLEQVETPATRRVADRDVAAVADEPWEATGVPTVGEQPDEAGTGPAAAEPGPAGGVAALVHPGATTNTAAGTIRACATNSSAARSSRGARPAAPAVTRPGNGPADADEPLAFTWRGRRYEVTRILGHWREEEGWWRRPDGEPIRIEQSDLWRVEAVRSPSGPGWPGGAHGIYELARRGRTWRLDRVWD